MPEALFNTLQEEEPIEQTEFEIREHLEAGGEFDSGRIKYMLNNSNKSSAAPIATNLTTPITPIFGLTTPITPVIRYTTNSTAKAEVIVSIILIIPSYILTLNILVL